MKLPRKILAGLVDVLAEHLAETDPTPPAWGWLGMVTSLTALGVAGYAYAEAQKAPRVWLRGALGPVTVGAWVESIGGRLEKLEAGRAAAERASAASTDAAKSGALVEALAVSRVAFVCMLLGDEERMAKEREAEWADASSTSFETHFQMGGLQDVKRICARLREALGLPASGPIEVAHAAGRS